MVDPDFVFHGIVSERPRADAFVAHHVQIVEGHRAMRNLNTRRRAVHPNAAEARPLHRDRAFALSSVCGSRDVPRSARRTAGERGHSHSLRNCCNPAEARARNAEGLSELSRLRRKSSGASSRSASNSPDS